MPTCPAPSLEGVSLSPLITDPILGSDCNSEQGRNVALSNEDADRPTTRRYGDDKGCGGGRAGHPSSEGVERCLQERSSSVKSRAGKRQGRGGLLCSIINWTRMRESRGKRGRENLGTRVGWRGEGWGQLPWVLCHKQLAFQFE